PNREPFTFPSPHEVGRRCPLRGGWGELFAIRYSLFAIRYSLFAIRYSLFAIRYSLFSLLRLLQQSIKIEPARHHHELAIGPPRPFPLRSVAIELDPVAIRVVEIERLAHPMIACTGKRDLGLDQAPQGIREIGARRVEHREMVESRRAGRRRA